MCMQTNFGRCLIEVKEKRKEKRINKKSKKPKKVIHQREVGFE